MTSPAGNALQTAASPSRVSVPDFDTVYESQMDLSGGPRVAWGSGQRTWTMWCKRCSSSCTAVWPSSKAGHSSRPGCSSFPVHVVRHYWRAHQRKPGDSAAEDRAEIQTLAATTNMVLRDAGTGRGLRVLDRPLAQLDQG